MSKDKKKIKRKGKMVFEKPTTHDLYSVWEVTIYKKFLFIWIPIKIYKICRALNYN